jgi:metal-dependent amidase/aminoacylase/carboxypeptidase family protein
MQRKLSLLALALVILLAVDVSGDAGSQKANLAELGLSPDAVAAEAKAMQSWIVEHRRKLHASPELMYDLSSTAAIIRAALDEIGVPYKYPVAKHGLVATIGSGNEPVVALRSDMDALPIQETPFQDTASFVSKNDGKMHACGHDGHMSMLLGAAKLLKAKEATIKGTVRLIFQPAEEGGAGIPLHLSFLLAFPVTLALNPKP